MRYLLLILMSIVSSSLFAAVSLEVASLSDKVTTPDGEHFAQPRLRVEKRRGFGAFSLDIGGYYPKGGMKLAYGELIFRGIGVHQSGTSVGALFGYKNFGPKFVKNEFDFSINRGILGGYVTHEGPRTFADLSYASYNPVNSNSTSIDSFPITISAFPYKKLTLKLGLELFLIAEAELGNFHGMKLFFGIPNFSFEEKHEAVTYVRGTLKFPLSKGRLFASIFSHDASKPDDLHRYLGTTVSNEILKGVSLGYEFSNF